MLNTNNNGNINNLNNLNNLNKKKNQKFGLHSGNNILQTGLLKNDKKKDIDGDKSNNRLYPKNETLNIQKIKTKIPKCTPNNNIKTIQEKKLKSIKKENSNLLNENVLPNSLLHPIPGISSASNNYLFQNRSLLPSNNIQKLTTHNPPPNPNPPFSSLPTNTPPKPESQLSSTTSSIANELKQMEYMKELLQSLLGSPLGLSSLSDLTNQTPVELSPEIFRNPCKNFEISITSNINTLEENNIIKSYAFNSSQGKIRDYNEDTIAVTKVDLNKNNINTNLENKIINKEKNEFYFFAVYDGHGGKGCSISLKENLNNNIKELSKQGI